MDTNAKICRCCLSECAKKDLNTPYIWLEKIEIYSDMLQRCFNIILSPHQGCNSICELCITSLRTSLHFKMQVLQSEEVFRKRISNSVDFNGEKVDVKEERNTVNDGIESDNYLEETKETLEVKQEPCNVKSDSDESEDYFLADAIKQESPVKKKRKMKKTTDKYHIKKLVAKLNTIDKDESKIKKQMKLPKDFMVLSNRYVKIKHKENLLTILKYSNALPFKDKNLIGFLCGYCGIGYPDPKDLRTHTEIEHEKDRFELKSSFDMSEYNVKFDITNLICTLCQNEMENLKQLKEHLVEIHKKTINNDIKDHLLEFKLEKGDVYNCAKCPSTYETFKMLKQHMNKHYSNYSCTKCDTSFATKRSLSAHQATHIEGSHKCDLCEKIFSTRAKKLYHEKQKHLGTRNISNCPFCDTSFRSYYQRNQHMIKIHNSEAPYKCNVCNKGYVLKTLLMCHIKKNHLMERNCQCTECGFRFFSKKALKAHMVKHTGEKKYPCEVCHKAYARKYTLREHMRIHNNDRRFKCVVCASAFVQKCSLKNHLLSHHGITMAASDIAMS